MISMTKIFTFEAAHHLPNHEGLCKNVHGHSYKLEVEISGVPKKGSKDPALGMIMDFGHLKKIVQTTILDRFDHTDLNKCFLNPTAETMVYKISSMLKTAFTVNKCRVQLQRVRLWETSTSYAEWKVS
jgi:6-pyruvoyltetrahydropterin/6-carboxytetrahydropterin synthase